MLPITALHLNTQTAWSDKAVISIPLERERREIGFCQLCRTSPAQNDPGKGAEGLLRSSRARRADAAACLLQSQQQPVSRAEALGSSLPLHTGLEGSAASTA